MSEEALPWMILCTDRGTPLRMCQLAVLDMFPEAEAWLARY